jgi:hypothetical protein
MPKRKGKNKKYVVPWHYKAYGNIPPSNEAQPAINVL